MIDISRLYDMVVEPGRGGPVSAVDVAVAGECKQPCVARLRLRAQASSDFISIHAGHAYIEDDDMRTEACCQADCRWPFARHFDDVSVHLKNHPQGFGRVGQVVHDQNLLALPVRACGVLSGIGISIGTGIGRGIHDGAFDGDIGTGFSQCADTLSAHKQDDMADITVGGMPKVSTFFVDPTRPGER